MTDRREKIRAVFLTALMIGSVFGAGISLTGSAAADVTVDGDTIYVDGGGANLSDALTNDATDGDTVVVNDTLEYNPITIDTPNVTVKPADDLTDSPTINASGSKTAVSITADGTTFTGFEVIGDDATKDGVALYGGDLKDVTVTDNVLSGMARASGSANDNTTYAIHNWGGSLDGVVVTNNDISNVGNTTYTDASTYPISLGPFHGDETVVEDNTITSVVSEDDFEAGILLYDDSGSAANVSVSGNDIGDLRYDVYSYGGQAANLNSETSTDAKISSLYESNTNFVNVYVEGSDRTDSAGEPGITDVEIEDRDDNGDIDNVTVTANESVRDDELEVSDFDIDGQTPDAIDTMGAYDNEFRLEFHDGNELSGTDKSPLDTFSATIVDLGETSNTLSSGDIKVTDSAEPVVTDVSVSPDTINSGNAPTNVDVTLTFSENVNKEPTTGTFQVYPTETTQQNDGRVDITNINVDKNTVSGTTDSELGDFGSDYFGGLDVGTLVNDSNGNTNVLFDSATADGYDRLLDVDRVPPELADNTITTLDTNDDGQVDQLEVEFNDDVNDDTVDTEDFTVSDPSGDVDSVDTGETANDDIVLLNVDNLPADDTSVTPDVSLAANSIEDTAGNTGPAVSGGETQESEDGASPVLISLSVEESVLNQSDVPADVTVNATFTENLSTDASVTLTGLGQADISTTSGGDGDNYVSASTDTQIGDNNEDVNVYVNVSGGDDSSGNAVETFNSTTFDGETLLVVDTETPTVSVNDSEAPDDGQVVNGTLDLSTYFDVSGADSDGGSTTYLINTTGDASGEFTEVSESFDSTTIEDTENLLVRAVGTDDVENEDQNTTGTINVDNTAPSVTIDAPSETKASQSGGTLTVETTVDEQNVDGNATVVLEGDGNTIQYNATVADLGNGIDLRLNTSANASANGARLPDLNVNATEGSFDTQTVYDLSVTVNDTTGKSTTETKSDALFLDDTAPANFSLVEPTTPTEYETGDGLQIAYGYTEDNTDEVTVSLTNESGAVANMTVDESLYVDDGVIKSFEANLFESFDTSSLADGRYNVSVTVTDLAGNELTDSTDNAPVAINNDDKPASDPQFNSGPDASVSVNKSAKEVTVDVSYNVSVPNVTDAGEIDQTQDVLDSVDITADNIGQYTVTYWDASADSYDTVVAPVNVTFSGENATENVDITETATLDLDTLEPTFEEDDRVTTRYLEIDGTYDEVAVELTDSSEDSQTQYDVVNYGTETFASESPAEPDIESIEVAGVDTPNNLLVIDFTRPVNADGGIGSVSTDDFAYEDVSGDGANYVTEVQGVNDGDDLVAIVLDEDVTAEDVGSDVVSIQPNTLENKLGSNAPAMNGTVDESDAPGFTSSTVDVGDDASTVDVTFNQKVVAEDGEALTADNFTYTGDASVESVDHQSESETATVHLDSEVAEGELGSEMIVANDVFDRFGNAASPAVTVVDETSPSNIEILEPTDQQIVQSGDLFDVSYQYVDNVPDNVDNAVVKLEGDTDTYTYQVDDTSYVTNVSKSLTLDLDDGAKGALTDGAYNLTIEVTDADGNMDSVTMEDAVVVNDEGPNVEDVTVTSGVDDVAPDSTLNVTYDYEPAPDATSVMVWVVDTDDIGNFTGDLENVTYEVHEVSVDHGIVDDKKVSVDLSGDLPDNEEYAVYVSATDVNGLMSDLIVAGQTVDVNAEKPTIESVEANTGDDSVTVTFNEDVTTTDGDNITRADFAYQDVNSAGASSIESVDDMGDEVVLHLDSDVTTSDLGSDLVNVADGALEDMDEHDPRPVDSSAVALSDSTEPTVGLVDAGPINANNEESYTVTVGTTSEVTDVSVTLTGPSGTELSASDAAATGDATLTFNASTLEDGQVDVDVELTDAGGNTASASVMTEKDTVAPTIDVAAANPGGSLDAGGKTQIVVVTFSEAVDADSVSADAFTVTSDAHSVDDVLNSDLLTNDDEVWLLLNQSVPTAAIDDGSVAQVEAPGITDEVGQSVTNAVNLTDEDAGSMYAPTHTPSFSEISAEAGDENVTVTFDEVVEAGDGGDLTAANFTYLDTNSANVSAVDSVTQTGPQTVVVTLDAELTEGDLAYDRIAVNEDAVFDTSGNVMPTSSTPFDLEPGLSTSTEDGAVTLQVTTLNDIETAVGDGLTVEETNLELASLEGFTLEDRFTANVSAEDFTEVEPGVYETSVDVPGDDAYTVSGLVDGEVTTEQVIVNEEAPHPTDAVILDVTSEAQLDDTRDTTHIRVLFSEPIDGSEILPSDVSIENFDGEIVEVRDGGLFGSIEIVVDGQVQTGASPDVTIAGDSYADLAGTSGASESGTVVHTDALQLSEGKNFVSVPAAAGELSLSELDTSAVDAIYAYDAESESWDAYDPDAPSNDFTSLEGGEGYIFVMDADATLDVNVYNIAGADAGADVTAPAPNQQTLTEGWNLIGHYQEYDQAVPTALSSVGMYNVYELYAQSDSSASFEYQSYAAGDFDSMERSEAYWVFVTNDEVYTEANGQYIQDPTPTNTAAVAV